MKLLILGLAGLLATIPARALSGNEALEWHRSSAGQPSIPLLAYVRGALDGERAFEEILRSRSQDSPSFKTVWGEMAPKMFCAPQGADSVQAYELLVKWLQEHPEQRQLDVAVHLRVALRQVWRCNYQ